jgi:hypothetical protein
MMLRNGGLFIICNSSTHHQILLLVGFEVLATVVMKSNCLLGYSVV